MHRVEIVAYTASESLVFGASMHKLQTRLKKLKFNCRWSKKIVDVSQATLVVLIWQNRRLQKTIYASNYAKLIEMLKDLRILRIENPKLARVYEGEVKGLSSEEIQHYFFNLIVLSIIEMLFINMKLKLITKETWKFWLESIRMIAREESFRRMVLHESYKIVNPEFFRIIKDIIQEVERETLKT